MIAVSRNSAVGAAARPALIALLCVMGGCDVDNLLNRTASFGGDTAGQRSQFGCVLINNTPYRALLTLGTYDDLDSKSAPQYFQYGNELGARVLAAGASSGPFALNCARVFAVGTPELVGRVRDLVSAEELDPDALIQGVYFTTGDLGTEEGALPTEGVAAPFEARLGVDFACNSSVIIRLEIDDLGPNPYRIDFEVIPATDDRNPPS